MIAHLRLAALALVALPAVATGEPPPERPASAVDVLCFAADRPVIVRFHVLLDGKPPSVPPRPESLESMRSGNQGRDLRATPEPDGGPLFACLDTDNDGQLSESERQRISETLRKLDLDDDETISTAELEPLGNPYQPVMATPSQSLNPESPLVPIVSAQSRRDLAKQLIGRYARSEKATETASRLTREESGLAGPEFARCDADSDGTLDFNELTQWLNRPDAAVEVVVRLGTREANEAPIQVIHSDDKLQAVICTTAANPALLTIGKRQIEIECDSSPKGDQIRFQVGMEARNLFEILDLNGDRRLSIRELRAAAARVKPWDSDGDGDILMSEIPKPVRLAFRRAPSSTKSAMANVSGQSSAGPGWFAIMDTNGDGDLSRREFLGRPEHFRAMDADGDGLIDLREASAWHSAVPARNR